MTDNVTRIRHEPDDHFGGCPKCGGDDGYLNVGRGHWFVCRRHKVRWFVGANLFSNWRHEEDWEWEENEKELEGYEEVEPLMPQASEGSSDAPCFEYDDIADIEYSDASTGYRRPADRRSPGYINGTWPEDAG